MSVDTTVARLAERNAAAYRARNQAPRVIPSGVSPCCRAGIQGTAVLWCGSCGHTFAPADIDHEVTR